METLTVVLGTRSMRGGSHEYSAVRKYDFSRTAGLTNTEIGTYLRNIAHCVEQALNQLNDTFGSDNSDDAQIFFFDEADIMEGGVDSSSYIRTPGVLDESIVANAQHIVSDILRSDAAWRMDLQPEDLTKIDFEKVTPLSDTAEEPKRISVGEAVYDKQGKKFIYGGIPPESQLAMVNRGLWNEGDTVVAPESWFVPQYVVDPKALDIEVFPTPNSYRKRDLNWFARMKKTRKFECFARTKERAIFKTALEYTFVEFWKE